MAKIAFYSPIKPIDHPIPSGDRLIANNIVNALKSSGHEVRIASKFITYMKRPTRPNLQERKTQAITEAQETLKTWQCEGYKPDAFFTYHPYDKAPDWLGSTIANTLKIPRLTAEACRTGQADFEGHREESQAIIHQAQCHLYLKPLDKEYLLSIGIDETKLISLPPFIDTTDMPGSFEASPDTNEEPLFVTVGMMRPGKKTLNYKILGEVFTRLANKPWKLVIIGNGPTQTEIEGYFSKIPKDKIHWAGLCTKEQVNDWMTKSRAFVWPGWKEPIGMVYLEAALLGRPSIAYRSMGVPLVVEHGESGLLADEDNIQQYADYLEAVINEKSLANRLGRQAQQKVSHRHSLSSAATTLSRAIEGVLKL